MGNGHEHFKLIYVRQFSENGNVYYEVRDVNNLEQACREALEHRPITGVSYYIVCGKHKKLVLPGHNTDKLVEILSDE